MLSTSQKIFALVFAIIFILLMVLAYRKDRYLHKTHYKGAFMIVLAVAFMILVYIVLNNRYI